MGDFGGWDQYCVADGAIPHLLRGNLLPHSTMDECTLHFLSLSKKANSHEKKSKHFLILSMFSPEIT
jgi:hypothetical protein